VIAGTLVVVVAVLGQAPKPVELVGRSRPPLLDLYPYALPVAGVVACLGALGYFGVRAAAERSSSRSPTDRRLSKIARRLGLTRADMELLKRLAKAHGRAEPAALLVSNHAFRESATLFAAGIVTPEERRRIAAIAGVLACPIEDVFSADHRTARDRAGRAGGPSVARRQAPAPGERRLSA
jgi:hypothetical protein